MLDAALARAEQEGLSHLSFLELILGEPAVRARQRAVERRIRDARFREEKTLAQFDWKFNASTIDRAQIEQLATGEFVRRGENLVMMGQSGVGKSFLLQAISRRFCELGYRVRYTTSADLLEDLRKTPMPGIDYHQVRQQVSMTQVLDLVGFQATWRRGPQRRGPWCDPRLSLHF